MSDAPREINSPHDSDPNPTLLLLGAVPGGIVGLVLREALVTTAAGLAIGVPLARVANSATATELFSWLSRRHDLLIASTAMSPKNNGTEGAS